MTNRLLFFLASVCLLWNFSGCGGDDGGGGGDGELTTYAVSGNVIDFETGDPISGQASVTVVGLLGDEVAVSVTGSDFEITGVPPHSVFQLLVSAGGYQQTHSASIEVVEEDVSGVSAAALSTEYYATLTEDFGVTPSLTKGVLIARATDEAGTALSGVDGTELYVGDSPPASGPYYLGADLLADPIAAETSASGYMVFFDVEPGTVSLTAAPDVQIGVVMDTSPVAGSAVTLADVIIGADVLVERPTGVSFVNDILPIFDNRGCTLCHAQSGPGKQQAGFQMDGGENKRYDELTLEPSNENGLPRVNIEDPENSLVLTMPGPAEDDHPNTTFAAGIQDPDYLLLLVWIEEGALKN